MAFRFLCSQRRCLSYASHFKQASHLIPSSRYTDPSNSLDPSVSTTPDNISSSQRAALDSALRVDQAGEVAANWIYKGQLFILGRDPIVGSVIQVSDFKSIPRCL